MSIFTYFNYPKNSNIANCLHLNTNLHCFSVTNYVYCFVRSFTLVLTATWASYQIHKIAGCACAGNAGKVFPRRRFQRKPLVSDPGMHHGTCVTHVPWCMSGSLTCGDGENIPGIPGACAPAILRIWKEAHSEHICFNNHLMHVCYWWITWVKDVCVYHNIWGPLRVTTVSSIKR